MSRSLFFTAVLSASSLFVACPGAEEAHETDSAPTAVAVTQVPTAMSPRPSEQRREGDEPIDIQRRRVTDAQAILTRLGNADDSTAPADRPGADSFRAAELGKLDELARSACRGADAPCRSLLNRIAEAGLPFDEVRTIYGRFLGELKPRAHIAASTLGVELMQRADGRIRDVAFRIAVGSGAARRGQPDEERRRGSTIPLRPRVGETTWVIFEWLTTCNDIVMQTKGPDARGRMDLAPTDPCEPRDDSSPGVVPRAIRAVWAGRIDALPESGIEVWLPGASRPLVAVNPRELAPAPKAP